MATKTTPKNAPANPEPEMDFSDCFGGEAPKDKDFKEASQPDIDGWWKGEEGLVFQGQIISHFTIEDGNNERDVVCVRLEKPTKARVGSGDDAKAVKLNAGQVLGVGISHKLQPMLEYVEHQGRVWCKAQNKVAIKGGRTMWNYDLRIKGLKAQPIKPAPTDDGAPF